MEIKTHGGGMIFCNGCVCDNAEFALPILIENHKQFGVSRVFVDEKQQGYAKNAFAILHGENMWCYFENPTRKIAEKFEFIAKFRHVVYLFPNAVEIACENGSLRLENQDCKSCDAYNFAGEDYIFLQFESYLLILFFDGVEYIASEKIPCTQFEVKNDFASLNFEYPSSCGLKIAGGFKCEEIQRVIFQNGGRGIFEKYHLDSQNNYIKETFAVYFFEIFMFEKFMSQTLKNTIFKSYISTDLLENLQAIANFFGNFCGIIPDISGVILLYASENNFFTCKKFTLEIETQNNNLNNNQNSNLQIVNVQEVQEFALLNFSPTRFNEISWCFM